MRFAGRVFSLCMLACSCLHASNGLRSAFAEAQTPAVSTVPSSALCPYRTLAQSAYDEYRKGDFAAAARTAGILEVSWDSSSSALKEKSPQAWNSIDEAMDHLIKPLFQYRKEIPKADAVQTAYETFVKLLDAADGPAFVDTSLGLLIADSGVLVVRMREGHGRQPKLGDIVVLRATGLLDNGSEFRHPPEDGSPGWFWLLPGRQPPGLIQAMSLLHVGDSAVIVVPASLGYGPNGGLKGAVPPNAALTYVVDLLDVKSDDVAARIEETIDAGGPGGSPSGVDAAIKEYRSWQAQGFPDQHLDEKQMNGLGYELLKKDDFEGSIKIFQLTLETYPGSANLHDSLGEAYAKHGEKEKAIEEYRKALALDPKMESSVQALKELLGQ
jgi:FKBP-type peptidyl-prolyl cis-trans isomerase